MRKSKHSKRWMNRGRQTQDVGAYQIKIILPMVCFITCNWGSPCRYLTDWGKTGHWEEAFPYILDFLAQIKHGASEYPDQAHYVSQVQSKCREVMLNTSSHNLSTMSLEAKQKYFPVPTILDPPQGHLLNYPKQLHQSLRTNHVASLIHIMHHA